MTEISQTRRTVITQVIVNGKVVSERCKKQIIRPAKDATIKWDNLFPQWENWFKPFWELSPWIRKRKKKKRLLPKR